jgi:hypothetical protein
MLLGLVLSTNYLLHSVAIISQKYGWAQGEKGLGRVFVTSHVRGTARVKQAATRKINLMLQNANQMHLPTGKLAGRGSLSMPSTLRSATEDNTFRNFVLHGESKVSGQGSFRWTWQHIMSGRLFDTEGIWLPTRLLVFQAGQLIFGTFTVYFAFVGVEYLADKADEAVDALGENLPQWV